MYTQAQQQQQQRIEQNNRIQNILYNDNHEDFNFFPDNEYPDAIVHGSR